MDTQDLAKIAFVVYLVWFILIIANLIVRLI